MNVLRIVCIHSNKHTAVYECSYIPLHFVSDWNFHSEKCSKYFVGLKKSPRVISLLVQLKRHTNKCMKRNDLLCVIQHNFRHSLLSSMIFFFTVQWFVYTILLLLLLLLFSPRSPFECDARVKWWICINWRKPSKLIQWKKISYVIRFIKPQSFSGLFFFGARSAYSSRELFVYYHNCELKCVAGLLKSTLNWEFYPE